MSIRFGFSTLKVKYSDIRYVVPFLTHFWLYGNPNAYLSSLIPEKWHWLYNQNPMTGSSIL